MEDSMGPQYGGVLTTAAHYLQGAIDPRPAESAPAPAMTAPDEPAAPAAPAP
jgi:hypothetical protein